MNSVKQQQDNFICQFCNKQLPKSSEVMHTINCKRIQEQEKKMNSININNKKVEQQPKPIKKEIKPIQIKEEPKIELVNCEKCGLKMPLNEIKDHLEAHKIQEEDNNLNETNDNSLNSNQVHSRNNSDEMEEPQEEGAQTTVETFENNGYKKVIKTMKDPSGRIIGRSEIISNGNNSNFGSNFMFQRSPFSNITSSFSRNFFNDENDGNFNINFRPNFMPRFPFGRNTDFSEFLNALHSNHSGEHGLSQNILNSLPEVPIENVDKMDDDKKNCVICLNDFKNGDKAIILPCIHLFHKDCITSWLKQNDKCPICKKNIQDDIQN